MCLLKFSAYSLNAFFLSFAPKIFGATGNLQSLESPCQSIMNNVLNLDTNLKLIYSIVFRKFATLNACKNQNFFRNRSNFSPIAKTFANFQLHSYRQLQTVTVLMVIVKKGGSAAISSIVHIIECWISQTKLKERNP